MVFTFGGVIEVDVEDPWTGDGISGRRAFDVLEVRSVEQGLLGGRGAGGESPQQGDGRPPADPVPHRVERGVGDLFPGVVDHVVEELAVSGVSL